MAKVKKGYSLVLRICNPDMSSRNGFVYPGVGGFFTVPDWKDNLECGNGAHGWLYGQGHYDSCNYWTNDKAKWLVVRVADSEIRMLGGKCKFHSGEVVFVGGKSEAADYIIANEPKAATVAVIGRIVNGVDEDLVTVGALGTATAGDRGTATAGDNGEIHIRWYDKKNYRYRTATGYVGEDGIKPNEAYKLDADHKFIKVQS